MKRIIDGEACNTETATHICDVGYSDLLYVTKNGTFFLAGIKSAPSPSSGILPLSKSEACDVVESACNCRECRTDEEADLIQELFGDIIEDEWRY